MRIYSCLLVDSVALSRFHVKILPSILYKFIDICHSYGPQYAPWSYDWLIGVPPKLGSWLETWILVSVNIMMCSWCQNSIDIHEYICDDILWHSTGILDIVFAIFIKYSA